MPLFDQSQLHRHQASLTGVTIRLSLEEILIFKIGQQRLWHSTIEAVHKANLIFAIRIENQFLVTVHAIGAVKTVKCTTTIHDKQET